MIYSLQLSYVEIDLAIVFNVYVLVCVPCINYTKFAYICSIEIIMVNRLVLNLTHAANSHGDSTFSKSGLGPPVFASNSILGNIGGPVNTSFGDGFDEDLDMNVSIYLGRAGGEIEMQTVAAGGNVTTEKPCGEVLGKINDIEEIHMVAILN